jgi:signal transduction histidine kinase
VGRLSVIGTPPLEQPRFRAIALIVTAISALVVWASLWRIVFGAAYLPHAFHYLSEGKQIPLHAASDLLIGAAYITISFTLAYLVHRTRRYIPFQWMFLVFGLFMISCGMVHLMEAVVLWKPLYWFLSDLKLVTAVASLATALVLPRLVPETLALIKDRRVKLEQANNRLQELITQRKQAEEALRASEKLATAGRLAATIAHEINNPLEAVTNLLFLMRTNHNPDYLNMAEQELARINHIAKQTLGFYRIDAKPTRLNLADVIEGVLGVFRGKTVSRKVLVGTSYRSTDEITGYSNELRQVFGNLIGNALDAMSSGGRLLVRTVSYRDGVRVTIADNGSGIARENLGKIFQPFFTANKEVGTGLGLWLTREIVQKHRGTIRVRSSTDPRRHGTVFMIWLPSAAILAHASAA